MTAPNAFQISLLVSAFLVMVVFAWLLVFSIVIMPGIANLKDAQYLETFKAIDGIIQNNQPIFVVIWIGTIPAIITSLALGVRGCNNAVQLSFLVLATVCVFIGQASTILINIPRNNRLKALEIEKLDDFTASSERDHFEGVWCRSNTFRVWIFGFAAVTLMVLLLLVE